MPKTWLYYIALLLPLLFGILVMHTTFLDWLWYGGHTDAFHLLNALRAQPHFVNLVAGWPLLFFVFYVLGRWSMEEDETNIGRRFLILPIAYVPFAVIGHALFSRSFDASTLYAYPLVVLIFGYFYVFSWVLCVWVFARLRIVL